MIKQLTVKNLFNFYEETTIDFTNSGEVDLVKRYNNESIGQFTLLYGKNNVGKTNLFKILEYTKDFIFENRNRLQAYNPKGLTELSLFEIIVEDEKYEIRYGFEVDVEKSVILDEWMFAKINGSTRESLLFDRSEKKISRRFKKPIQDYFEEVNDNILMISHFLTIKEPDEVVKSLLMILEGMHFLKNFQSLEQELIRGIIKVHEQPTLGLVLSNFFKTADIDVEDIVTTELSSDENDFMNKLLLMQTESKDGTNSNIESFIEDNIPVIKNLLGKSMFGKTTENKGYKIEVKHKNGAYFSLDELSTGSRQVIGTILFLIDKIGTSGVILLDELEIGLHPDITSILIGFLEEMAHISPDLQFIISTHRAELLDSSFISKQNKVFMVSQENFGHIDIRYLSEYRLREYHKISDRYELNAFGTSPNTSNQYHLFEAVKEIGLGMDE